VALLILAHPLKAADQWIWRPSIGREQRIAIQDRSTRFFGTDFSFEDLEERDVSHFDWKLAGEEKDSWKIEARPRKASQYTYSRLWVRKDNYTLTQVESYNKDGLVRVIHYRDFERLANVWIARTTEVLDAARKSRTILHLDKVEINIPLNKADFTLEALRAGG
jgi:outer membrane lipoprotein-sorting protein